MNTFFEIGVYWVAIGVISLTTNAGAAGASRSTTRPSELLSPSIHVQIDWPQFMARQDPVWEQMPADYFEGPFVGNGLLGTILFKDDQRPNTLRFEIGRTDVYDHRPGTKGVARLPIGQLLLTPVGTISSVHLRTDLWNAEIRGLIKTTAGTLTIRCFVPSGEEFIVVNLETTAGEDAARFSFRPEQGNHPRYTVQPNRDKGFVYTPNPPFLVEKRDGMETITQPLLVGDDYATAWNEHTDDDGSRTVLLTVANRWAKDLTAAKGSADDAVATIRAALRKEPAAVERAHREWWHAYYPASFVSLPDPHIESFYWIQLYKLASATHPNRPVVDLMGPWFRKSVWNAYWYNLNVQLAYFTTGVTNHLELAEPLYKLIDRRTSDLIENVPEAYRSDCAGLGTVVGYGSLHAPIALDDRPQTHRSLIALPWIIQLFYDHNRLTMDDQQLRDVIYPLMKRTFQVYVRLMKLGPDGKYHLPLAFSDEYGYAEDTSLNLALARWGFNTLIKVAERLKIDEPMLPTWKARLAEMADLSVDSSGIMIGKDVPFSRPHRHYSHLFAIFPLHTLNVEQDADRIDLIKKSLRHFTDVEGDNCMFKFTGASSLWAAIGDGDEALKWLQRSLEQLPRAEPTVGPNTLYSERGWQTFESPIAASRSTLDMLVQSWGGTIRIFPACPSAWPDVVFHDLRAEGGFLVSAERKAGKTRWACIQSLAGEPCRVTIDGITRDVKLAKGEELVFGDAEPIVRAVTKTGGDVNGWGLAAPEVHSPGLPPR